MSLRYNPSDQRTEADDWRAEWIGRRVEELVADYELDERTARYQAENEYDDGPSGDDGRDFTPPYEP